MTVHVLVPVFNRLHHTKRLMEALRGQTIADRLNIIITNDGSTDGTSEYLRAQPDVVELSGDGNLWWGGAIELGLRHVLRDKKPGDYVVFLNNDTWFGRDYLETLVRVSQSHGGAAVGSVIHETGRNPPLVSIGPRVDINRVGVWDLLDDLPLDERDKPKPYYRVDALSGRGTLYPVEPFDRWGTMRPFLLPHYLADYEIAMRFARRGVPLIVSSEAIIHSPAVYGGDVSGMGFWERCLSVRSSSNIVRRFIFFMLVGSPLQRATAPLRVGMFGLARLVKLQGSSRHKT